MTDGLSGFHPDDWVGRSLSTEVRLHRETVEALAHSLDRPAPRPGAPLEPLRHWLWLFAPPAQPASGLGEDGHPARGALIPDWPLPRRMWAASAVTWHADLPLDATVIRETRVESVSLKAGRSGPLGFVGLRHRWLHRGLCAIDDLQTLVYRQAPIAPIADHRSQSRTQTVPDDKPATPGAHYDGCVAYRPDPVLLFRYSALTFNAHRIHYDTDYAMRVEGYPGRVIHGPLLATLMLDAFLDRHHSARPRRFEFRAVSPAFEGQTVWCTDQRLASGQARLAVLDERGQPHLNAELAFD